MEPLPPVLTFSQLRELFAYNEVTGEVRWLQARQGRDLSKPVGHRDTEGYLRVTISGRRYRLHRVIYMMMTCGAIPDLHEIDHKNGDRSDNRWRNLRLVTSRTNNQNRKTHRSGKLIGACFHKPSGRWQSAIRKHGHRVYLGSFPTEVDAHNAYVAALAE